MTFTYKGCNRKGYDHRPCHPDRREGSVYDASYKMTKTA